MDLSVIIPAYNCGSFLEKSLSSLLAYLPTLNMQSEVILVNDGSEDNTAEVAARFHVKLIDFTENRGKGAAIRAGMAEATGKVRIYTDADLPYGLEVLPLMAFYIRERKFHAVIGNRNVAGSVYSDRIPITRQAMSKVCSLIVGMLVAGGYHDTQCGLKAFEGKVADSLFRISRIDRFACDVEYIYLLLCHSLDIKHIPVQLAANYGSSVRFFSDSIRFLRDLARIVYYRHSKTYHSAYLENLFTQEHGENLVRAAWDFARGEDGES